MKILKKKEKYEGVPSLEELQDELQYETYKTNYIKTIRNTVFTLVTVAAIAVLVAVFILPVLQIYGHSMTPGLDDGNIVVSVKDTNVKKGDVIAFYYNNKILVKRVIATSGEWVNIDSYGNVYVNNEKLDEPYIQEKSLGDSNIQYPYQVPEGRKFVMGDHRSVSVDSRNSSIGCVADEQIVGKLVFKIWPITKLGPVE